jgi:cell division initiation protein
MELTPQRLREVEFRQAWRGYDEEEVDELLERVAAGLEDFERRIREATERAVRAEQRASEGGDTDDTLRRTLVLAQRTADAAISDANERAARLVSDAEIRAAALVADAEAEARRIADESETQLRENVSALESARSTLQDDVDALGRYLDDERGRVRTTLQALITRIDTDLRRDSSAPAQSAVSVPEPAPAPEAEVVSPADAGSPADDGSADAGSPAEVEAAGAAAIDLVEAERPPSRATEEHAGEPTQAHDVLADEDNDDDELVLSGPGRAIDTDDDAFFAQLRGALDDDEPLGPRDEEPQPNHVGAPAALFDQEHPEGRLGPFLRRKRREA